MYYLLFIVKSVIFQTYGSLKERQWYTKTYIIGYDSTISNIYPSNISETSIGKDRKLENIYMNRIKS